MKKPTDDLSPEPEGRVVAELDLRGGGLWMIGSLSATRYFLDLDRWLLLRAPGPGSPTGPFDNCWVALTGVEDAERDFPDSLTHTVRVGRRHRYHLDPRPGDIGSPTRWWLQRTVTIIQAVSADRRPTGRLPASDEDAVRYHYPATP